MKTTAEIQAWLVGQTASLLGTPEAEIGIDSTFDSFGLASRDAVSLSGDLEDYLGRRFSPTLLYQYPTIRKLTEHLSGDKPEPVPPVPPRTGNSEAPVEGDAASYAAMTDEEAEARLLARLADLEI